MSTPLAMLHPELLDPDDIQAIRRDDLIMALNRKVDLLTRNALTSRTAARSSMYRKWRRTKARAPIANWVTQCGLMTPWPR
jgi:hypothetical protein